jgi:threonine/homoserine/homoserine lactone efflux protein
LPVLGFAIVIAWGTNAVGRAYERVAKVERGARLATGAVFVLAGVYLTLACVYRVL